MQSTFALDFLTGTLDPSITFTRADATATRINSSGLIESVAADTPRFDSAPVTLTPRGLLIEEPRTNLIVYSQELDNAAWVKTGLNTTGTPPYVNVAVSPDGTQNADKVIEAAVSSTHSVRASATLSATTTYTYSFFAKAGERTSVLVTRLNSAVIPSFSHTYNLANGTASGGGQIQNYGNGWYRCIGTFTTTGSGVAGYFVNLLSGSSSTYLGDGTSGAFVWGAQLEAGAFATSYIPTTTTALTRNADLATITGSNFSDWWQAGRGGATVTALPSIVSGTRPLIQFDDGTANEIIALRGNTTNPELYIVDGGSPQAQIDAGTIAANTAYSLTGWWQTNFCAARKDNGARVEDLTATIPTVTQARLGSDGTNYLNGHLATISYYDQFSSQIYTRRKNKAVFNVI
jgi:hypothetical protein